MSGLGDVLVSVKRSPVQEETRSAVGLHWGDCIIDKENFDDAWEAFRFYQSRLMKRNGSVVGVPKNVQT